MSLKVSSKIIFDTGARLRSQSGNGPVPCIGCLSSTALTLMLENFTNTHLVLSRSIVYSPVHVTIFLLQQKCLSKVSRLAFYNKPFSIRFRRPYYICIAVTDIKCGSYKLSKLSHDRRCVIFSQPPTKSLTDETPPAPPFLILFYTLTYDIHLNRLILKVKTRVDEACWPVLVIFFHEASQG